MDKTPQQSAAVERLKNWAATEGNRIFKWGTPGDMDRCIRFYREGNKMPEGLIGGFCADVHKRATGKHPGGGHKGKGGKD